MSASDDVDPVRHAARERLKLRKRRIREVTPQRRHTQAMYEITEAEIDREISRHSSSRERSAPHTRNARRKEAAVEQKQEQEHSVEAVEGSSGCGEATRDEESMEECADEHVDERDVSRERSRRRSKGSETMECVMQAFVEQLMRPEVLNRVMCQWINTHFGGNERMESLMNWFMESVLTMPIHLRLFQSESKKHDRLWLFGADQRMAIPFVFLSNIEKITIAKILRHSRQFFGKCQAIQRGVCGRMFFDFVHDDLLEQAVCDQSVRYRILHRFTMHVLHFANERMLVQSAVCALITAATAVIGESIVPYRTSQHLVYSMQERRRYDEVTVAVRSLCSFLTDAREVARQLMIFSKSIERHEQHAAVHDPIAAGRRRLATNGEHPLDIRA